MSHAPILIVEDEPKLAALLVDYLRAAGLSSVVVQDGLQAVPAVHLVPIIMMTARVEEVDRLLGLALGADDYLCKPYSPRELVARVQAQLRRAAWATPAASTPALGRLVIDEDGLRAILADQVLELTPAEFRLLRTLSSQPGRVFSRDQLLDQLHDDGRAVTDRAVDSHIRNLRRKLQSAPAGVDPIRSVYGVGYAYEWPAG